MSADTRPGLVAVAFASVLLALPPCRSLASRIAFAARLQPLPRRRFGQYLQLRMTVAGWRGAPVFSDAAVWLLCGPEGGLSPAEQQAAQRTGFAGVGLGPRVLRTETAAVAALAAMQALWGDF